MLCHGCPDAERVGTEPDPRGFDGLLCEDCEASARVDVKAGHAELGPHATPEAHAKAAEVEAAYKAQRLADAEHWKELREDQDRDDPEPDTDCGRDMPEGC